MITFRQNPRDYLEFLVLQKFLESKGYKYIGNSAPTEDSEDFNAEVMQRVQSAERVMVSSVIEYNSLYSQNIIVPGKWAYFAYYSDDDLPDTLRGGFRVERVDPFESPAGSFAKITRRLPSELLHELGYNRMNVLLENVKMFYFEHPEGYDALVRCGLTQFKNRGNQKLHYPLSADDIRTLSRMETDKVLNLNKLSKKTAPEDDRRAGNSLKDLIDKGLAVPIRKSSPKHVLSKAATEGEYTALVEKKYLPDYLY